MLIRIDAEVAAGAITSDRAESLKRSIIAAMQRYADRFHNLLVQSTRQAAEIAAGAHAQGLSAASQAAGVSISYNFASVPVRALENMMMRRGLPGGGLADTYRTLINRKIQHIAPEIDRILTSAIARGTSSNRLTTELAAAMAREDDRLMRTLRSLGPRGGRTAEAIASGVEIPGDEIVGARRLLFDSRRIATTEILTAHHESDHLAMVESPVVKAVRWQTSGRHDIPDACDVLEQSDIYGMGAGVFPTKNAPSKPHPFCRCHLVSLLAEPDEWDRAPEPPEPLRLAAENDVRKVLSGGTDKYIESQREMINQRLRLAREAAEDLEEVAA